ncbi:3'-5' exoribonuclease [Herbaspirillum autotrophicum]|uniref:3'-5' exoribonuclease n=1 Tax=Herbaspirillum autotrophicum TaxID=180195 RepID=UPI00067D3FB2
MKIFLDTEFTDFVRPHLISIGMAADSDDEFYAEIPYPYDECSDFVREVVLPLLGKFPDATYSKQELAEKLRSWLDVLNAAHGTLEICFDFQTDWDLFIDALDYQVPKWCVQKQVNRNINELLYYEYHKKNALPEHHALYDARANRFAYRERPDVVD